MRSAFNSKLSVTEVLATAAVLMAVTCVTTPILAHAKTDDKLGGKMHAERINGSAMSMYLAGSDDFDISDHEVMKSVMTPRGVKPKPQLKLGLGALSNTGTGISWHGGPVMTATQRIYIIWYGSWSQPDLIRNFAANLTSSSTNPQYYAINTTYGTGSLANQNVNGQMLFNYVPGATTHSLADEYTDTSLSQGTRNLSDSAILAIVKNAVSHGLSSNTYDPNGVYFVLTGSNVSKSGFCTRYCGWHSHATINGIDVKYSFVGNPTRCPSSCAGQSVDPSSFNAGAEAGAVSIIAHEAEEAVTDPDLNAWYDSSGAENADKCAWNFGTTSTAPNGGKFNITVNGTPYLVQQNWQKEVGACQMKY